MARGLGSWWASGVLAVGALVAAGGVAHAGEAAPTSAGGGEEVLYPVFSASVEPGRTFLDVVQFTQPELRSVRRLAAEADERSDDDGWADVPADDPRIPQRFKLGTVFTVVTEAGRYTAEVTGFRTRHEVSADHLGVILGPAPEKLRAKWGEKAPRDGLATVGTKTRLKLRRALAPRMPSSLARRVLAAAKASLSPGERGLLSGKPLGPKQLASARGRLGRAVRLVSVTVPITDTDFASGLLLVDRTGAIVQALRPMRIRAERYVLRWVVGGLPGSTDRFIVDADGGAESFYRYLIRYDGAQWRADILTGWGG